jgi:hypothetical protein
MKSLPTSMVPIAALVVGSWFGSYLAFPGKPFLSVVNGAAILVLIHFIVLSLRGLALSPNEQRTTARLIAPLVLFFGVVLWTALATDRPLWELRKAFGLVVGLATCLGFALAARSRGERLINLITLGLWGCTLALGAFEAWTRTHLPNSRSATDPSLAGIPTGFFWNPNDLATAMMLVLPFLWIYNLERGRIWVTRFLVVGTAALLTIIASRGALLAWVVTLGLVFITGKLTLKRMALAGFVVGLTLVALPATIELVQARIVYGRSAQGASERFFTRMGTATTKRRSKDGSLAMRRLAVERTMTFLDQRALGMGSHGADRFLGQGANRRVFNPHSLWLELALAWGMPGLALFFAFWLGLVIEMVSILRRKSNDLDQRALARASLVGLFIFALVTNIPSSVLRGLHLVWFPLGIAMLTALRQAQMKEQSGHEARDSAVDV